MKRLEMVSESVRSDINYIVYAYNTLDPKEIAFNLPQGTPGEIDEVLKEDFGVK